MTTVPGDMLFFRKGTPHRAIGVDGPSLHLCLISDDGGMSQIDYKSLSNSDKNRYYEFLNNYYKTRLPKFYTMPSDLFEISRDEYQLREGQIFYALDIENKTRINFLGVGEFELNHSSADRVDKLLHFGGPIFEDNFNGDEERGLFKYLLEKRILC